MKNDKLIQARKDSSLTQVEVARQAGITTVCYQRYESGERIPRADVAILIAKILKSTVEKLF